MNTRSLGKIGAAALVALALAGGGAAVQGQAAGTGAQPSTASQPVGVLVIDELGGAPTAVQGFGFEMTNPASPIGGGGGGAGKATLSDVQITRVTDSLSPQLFRAGVMGTHLPSVRITLYGSGKAEAIYVLSDAVISGFSSADGSERVAFAFRRIQISAGGSQTCFDLAEYAVC